MTPPSECAFCGTPIQQPPVGRKRLTCSARCRKTKWERDQGRLPYDDRWPAPDHGTTQRYRGSKRWDPCRCDVCRAGTAARMRAWRAAS